MSLRPLDLPSEARLPANAGVFLSCRPGCGQSFADAHEEMRSAGITDVFCLLSDSEWELAGDYRRAVVNGSFAARHHRCPLKASFTGEDAARLLDALPTMAAVLRRGGRVMIHCEAGWLRTGSAATALLVSLGQGTDAAIEAARNAGSDPEAHEPNPVLGTLCAEIQEGSVSKANVRASSSRGTSEVSRAYRDECRRL